MKRHIIPFLFIMMVLLASQGHAQKLRIETQDSQKFIIHKVLPKETLWRITQTYDVSQEELVKYNEGIDKVLKSGTEIRVPYTEPDNPKLQAQNTTLEATNVEIKHKVAKGEWLTKIAKEYEVSVGELKKWNDLDGEKITPGQELIVGIGKSKSSAKNNRSQGDVAKDTDKKGGSKSEILKTSSPDNLQIHIVKPKETLAAIKRTYGVSIAEIKEWNSLDSDIINVGQKIRIYSDNKPNVAASNTNVQTGFEWIENTPAGGNNSNTSNSNAGTGFEGLNNANNNSNAGTGFEGLNNANNNSNTGTGFEGLNNASTNAGTQQNPNRGGGIDPQIYTQASTIPLSIKITDGMTIYKLQNQYNVRKTEIRYWNNMPPTSNDLKVGDVIKLYPPQQIFHTLQAGETLASIATQYDVSVRQLEIWNNFQQNQGEQKKEVGQSLVIFKRTGPKPTPQFENPKTDGTTQTFQVQQNNNTANVTNNAQVQQQPSYKIHVVGQNEYLFDIANIYGVKMRDIKEWNNLPAVGNPTSGTRLRIYDIPSTQQTDYNQSDVQNNPNMGQDMRGATNTNTGTNSSVYSNPYDTNYKYDTNTNQSGTTGNYNTRTNNGNYNPATTNGNYSPATTNGNYSPATTNGNYSPATTNGNYNPATTNRNYNSNSTNQVNPFGSSEYQSSTDKYINKNSSNVKTTDSAVEGVNVTEKGSAAATSISNAKPFVALHRTLPPGSMVIVKNLLTGANIVVEVVANINPNTARAGVVIEVTNAAFSRLGAVPGQLLEVELTYTLKR